MLNIIITMLLCVMLASNNSIKLFAQSASEQKYRLAETYEKSGDFDAAARLYEELYKEAKQEKYFNALAKVYKSQNRFQELKPIIDEQLNKNKSLDLLILSGEIEWQIGSVSAANSAWNEALSLYGNDANTYTKLTATLNSLRLFDKAITTLKEARKKFPDNLSFADGLSRLYIITGNYADGLDEVIHILRISKDLQLAQGKIFALMNTPESIAYLDKTFQKELKRDDNTLLLQLYGWYLRTGKNFTKALEVFVELDKRLQTKGAQIYRFGEDSRRDGEYDIALQAFQKVIVLGNTSQYVHSALFAYAKTMEEKLQNNSNLSRNEATKIIKSYSEIIEKHPKTQYSEESKLRVAYLQNTILNDPKSAISVLQDMIKTNFNTLYSIQAMYALSEIYLQVDSLNSCEEILKKIIATYGKQISNPQMALEVNKSKYLQAELYFYRGEMDSALAMYQQLGELTDSDIANDALGRITIIQQNKDFVKALGTLAKAELALKQKKISSAVELYKEVAKYASSEQIGEKAIIQYAELEISLNNLQVATQALNEYISTNMYPIYGDNALFLLGTIAEKQKNKPEAILHYTDLLVKYPRSIFVIDARKRIKELRDTM